MPTLNPRVNVTLSPSLDLLVERLSALRGVSKAQVLRELLEAAEPALQRAVALMEAASRATPEVLTGLSGSLLRAQERIEDVLAGTMARIEGGQADLVAQAEAVQERRPARTQTGAKAPGAAERAPRSAKAPPAVEVARNPPASNRGVRSPGRRATTGRKAGQEGR